MISVVATPAIREAYAELAPLFETDRVATTWVGTAELVKRLDSGEPPDVVICLSTLLDELMHAGKLAAGSRIDIASSLVGVAVPAGAPKPDFGSPEALKKTLLAASTIGISTGPSGVYLNELFQRLGILDQVKAKFRKPPPGGMVGELLARGEAAVGFQQVAELVHQKGIDYLGPLPDSLQRVSVFSGGVHARSREPQAAGAFLRFLGAAEHAPVLRRHGLSPG